MDTSTDDLLEKTGGSENDTRADSHVSVVKVINSVSVESAETSKNNKQEVKSILTAVCETSEVLDEKCNPDIQLSLEENSRLENLESEDINTAPTDVGSGLSMNLKASDTSDRKQPNTNLSADARTPDKLMVEDAVSSGLSSRSGPSSLMCHDNPEMFKKLSAIVAELRYLEDPVHNAAYRE